MLLIAIGNNKFTEVDEIDWDLSFYTWYLAGKGYPMAWIDGKNVKMATIIAKRMGLHNPEQIDHIDQNKLNNKRDNLRAATNQLNQANRGVNSNNHLGIKGVRKMYNKYQARICINRRSISLGYFNTIEEASKAYIQAAKRYFGEFASN